MNLLDSIGSLALGERADLILIDRDVLTVSPEEMREAKILWTTRIFCSAIQGSSDVLDLIRGAIHSLAPDDRSAH